MSMGTLEARIFRSLRKKPKTARELVYRTRLSGIQVRSALQRLMDKGYVFRRKPTSAEKHISFESWVWVARTNKYLAKIGLADKAEIDRR